MNEIQEARWTTTWASDGISAAAIEATSHVGVAESTGKAVEQERPHVDDAISEEVQ